MTFALVGMFAAEVEVLASAGPTNMTAAHRTGGATTGSRSVSVIRECEMLAPALGSLMRCNSALQQLQSIRCFATNAEQLAAIKLLRERSGAPITDVKSALVEADWRTGKQDRSQTACSLHAVSPPSPAQASACCRGQTSSSKRSLGNLADSAMDVLRKKGLAAAGRKVCDSAPRTAFEELSAKCPDQDLPT